MIVAGAASAASAASADGADTADSADGANTAGRAVFWSGSALRLFFPRRFEIWICKKKCRENLNFGITSPMDFFGGAGGNYFGGN